MAASSSSLQSLFSLVRTAQQRVAEDFADRRLKELCAARIQAAWRRAAASIQVARQVACNYRERVVQTCLEKFTQRMTAKAFIAARNFQIKRLRQEVAEFSGLAFYLHRRQREVQIQEHLENEKHRLRAALLIQAWWKGCSQRGIEDQVEKGKRQKEKQRTERSGQEHLAFFDNQPRTLQEQTIQHEVLASGRLVRRRSEDGESGSLVCNRQLPRKIHIYFSDTGGGHRASALALEAALRKQYVDQVSIELIDFIRDAMPWPLCQAPETYQTLGHFPSVYKRAWDYDQESDTWQETTSYQMIWSWSKEHLLKYLQPRVSELDLIISVHPLIHHLVIDALEDIARGGEVTREEMGLPVVTVVTDLGSAHLSWFDPRIDLLFVPSQEIYQLAMKHGVSQKKINLSGLPLREGFWSSDPVPVEQKQRLQEQLGLRPTERPEVVLIMGGGEGFGKLFDVACAIGSTLIGLGYGQLVVVCGRNEEVRKSLSERRWMPRRFGEWLFEPLILGFVKNIDQYMAAADCLVTKAGPGSIAEAMMKGLPCLLTAFVPGQEEGNIRYVTENDAGAYISDEEPEQIAAKIAEWLSDPEYVEKMSANARRLAKPDAALHITRRICDGLLDLGIELEEVNSSRFRPRREQLLQRKERRQAKMAVSEDDSVT